MYSFHKGTQFRKLCGYSGKTGCPTWVQFEPGLEDVTRMFTSRGGGRKAQVKGTLNKGAERGLEHRGWGHVGVSVAKQ